MLLAYLARMTAFIRKLDGPLEIIQCREASMRQNLPMILIRVIVGLVFLLEGALKFLRPEELGAGALRRSALPFPHQLAPLVGSIEIGGGVAILLNFYAGDAALALLAVILTALIATKFPILLGRPLGPFALAKA
jgi:putative oxidoreductase